MPRRFEVEPRATEPPDFAPWLDELSMLADAEGFWPLMIGWTYAPPECCAYLQILPGAWAHLEARARLADALRQHERERSERRMRA